MKELRSIQANPDNAILVVVDMQKEQPDFVSKPQWWGANEWNPRPSTAPAIIPAVRGLVDKAHESGVRVIYTQTSHTHQEPRYTVFGAEALYKIGTRGWENYDELAPEPRDIVVRKGSQNPWYETDLEQVLVALVPDPTKCQVLITGGGAVGCAYFATMGFYVRNYQAVLVLDALYSGPMGAAQHLSRMSYPAYPNVFLSRSDLIEFSTVAEPAMASR